MNQLFKFIEQYRNKKSQQIIAGTHHQQLQTLPYLAKISN